MDTDTPQKILNDIQTTTGWSQPRIAKESGITQPTVCRLLKGQPECKSSTWRAIVELRDRVNSASGSRVESRCKPSSVTNTK